MMRESPHRKQATFDAEVLEASAGPDRSFHKTLQVSILCRLPNNERRQGDGKLNPRGACGWTGICDPNLSTGSL